MNGSSNIRRLTMEDAELSTSVITESFVTVARDLGLTRENCPSHPSFLTVDKIRSAMDRGVIFFGIFIDGTLVGTVALEKSAWENEALFLQRLAVLPGHRHHGYAGRLLAFCFDYAKSLNSRKISIGVIDHDDILKSWYEGWGFKVVKKRKYKHLPFTVCVMDKMIK